MLALVVLLMHRPLTYALSGKPGREVYLSLAGFVTMCMVVMWYCCYDRGKLIANRLGSFNPTGLGVTRTFHNFRNRYEYMREERLNKVSKSGLAKEVWYAIEMSLDTNSIYLGVLLRYYAYVFGYIYNKCILKIMVALVIIVTAFLGKGIRWWNYLEILGFCVACGASNIYVAKILPLEYREYSGTSFRDFEEFELNRRLRTGKIDEDDYEQYMKVEVWSRT